MCHDKSVGFDVQDSGSFWQNPGIPVFAARGGPLINIFFGGILHIFQNRWDFVSARFSKSVGFCFLRFYVFVNRWDLRFLFHTFCKRIYTFTLSIHRILAYYRTNL